MIHPVPDENPSVMQKARLIKNKYEDQFLALPGVIGVGIAYVSGIITLVILVTGTEKDEASFIGKSIPTEIEGLPVEVREIGQVQAQ
jgi:hypothetical protein